jgi:hypothetical protein
MKKPGLVSFLAISLFGRRDPRVQLADCCNSEHIHRHRELQYESVRLS